MPFAHRAWVFVTLLIATFTLATAGTAADAEKTAERLITVSASASIAVVPDIAQVSTGVVTEANSAREALARNSAIMTKVIESLKTAGIAADDIQTSGLNLSPRQTPGKEGRPPTLSGYTVTNQVRVTVRDLKR